jgi:hypothetical protein
VAGKVRIGISGWRYAGWRGVFYPPKLPQRSELAFAAKNFNSIEINGTHYSLQRPEYFAQWAAETPDDFAFAVKGSTASARVAPACLSRYASIDGTKSCAWYRRMAPVCTSPCLTCWAIPDPKICSRAPLFNA